MKKILIVDDNEANLYLLQRILLKKGYQVFTAHHGQDALEFLNRDVVDMIVSDVLMPVMDGYLLCMECKRDERLQDIPFVFYSSIFTDTEDEAFALKLGAYQFIQKPTDPEQLSEMLEDILVNYKAQKVQPGSIAKNEDEIMKLYYKNLINKLEKKNRELEEQIIERQKAEEFIKVSEAKYRSLIEQASDGVLISDMEGNILEYNESILTLLGYSTGELDGTKIEDIISPETWLADSTGLSELKKNRSLIYEKVFEGKDGSQVDVEIHARITDEYRIIGSIRDITQRKKAERELQLLTEELRKLASHQEDLREKERKEMAREIHDELGQQLTGLKMELALLSKKVSPENESAKALIHEIQNMANDIVVSMRRIIFQLRPSILDDFGLIAALESFASEFEKRFQIKTTFISSHDVVSLAPDVATELFRIVQESMNNIAKYSKAQNVLITFDSNGKEFVLAVNDDGIGFDLSILTEKHSYGIVGMRERAIKINGTFEIESTPGKGTSVIVRVPGK